MAKGVKKRPNEEVTGLVSSRSENAIGSIHDRAKQAFNAFSPRKLPNKHIQKIDGGSRKGGVDVYKDKTKASAFKAKVNGETRIMIVRNRQDNEGGKTDVYINQKLVAIYSPQPYKSDEQWARLIFDANFGADNMQRAQDRRVELRQRREKRLAREEVEREAEVDQAFQKIKIKVYDHGGGDILEASIDEEERRQRVTEDLDGERRREFERGFNQGEPLMTMLDAAKYDKPQVAQYWMDRILDEPMMQFPRDVNDVRLELQYVANYYSQGPADEIRNIIKEGLVLVNAKEHELFLEEFKTLEDQGIDLAQKIVVHRGSRLLDYRRAKAYVGLLQERLGRALHKKKAAQQLTAISLALPVGSELANQANQALEGHEQKGIKIARLRRKVKKDYESGKMLVGDQFAEAKLDEQKVVVDFLVKVVKKDPLGESKEGLLAISQLRRAERALSDSGEASRALQAADQALKPIEIFERQAAIAIENAFEKDDLYRLIKDEPAYTRYVVRFLEQRVAEGLVEDTDDYVKEDAQKAKTALGTLFGLSQEGTELRDLTATALNAIEVEDKKLAPEKEQKQYAKNGSGRSAAI